MSTKDLPTQSPLELNPNQVEGDMKFPAVIGLNGRAGILRGSGIAWPNGIVPYIFAPGYTYDQELSIIAGMRMLERTVAINNYRCVQFRPRNVSDPYYIIFENGLGCSSYVGQNPGRNINRTVTLQASGCLGIGTIMHELLHALGRSNNFDKLDNNSVNTYNTPYDYGSLMHYSSTAFSINGLPTIVARQANVIMGQRSNLSVYDAQAVQRFYNCTASGTTLPPTSTSAPLNIYGANTTYSSAWATNSRKFLRYRGTNANYYYDTYQVTVSTANYYRFKSSYTVIVSGATRVTLIPTSNTSTVLTNTTIAPVTNDDTGGYFQFLITYILQAGTTYILIFTTYSPNVTTSFSIMAWGQARVSLVRLNMVSSTTTTTTLVTTTTRPNVINITGIVTNYSSSLNNTSPRFTRFGPTGIFYFEAIRVTVNTTGTYTFKSNCSINSYGYLYVNSFNPSNVTSNLVALDDDTGGYNQFLITYILQAGTTYILIFTTYSPNVTTSFSIMAWGPTRFSLQYINMRNSSESITTVSSTSTIISLVLTTAAPVICNGSNIRLTCPGQVVTNGIIVTMNPNRISNSGYVTPNNTFFNLNDSSTVNGYVRTVSIQYVQQRLPTASTRIWIYGIIPILGGYMACSQYLVPSSQISTTQLRQTYNITANTINVFPGTYIGVGIQDGLTSIATTSGTTSFSVTGANLTSNILTRTPLYFRPDNSGFGVNVSYTIMA
ncbi:unnamed protein product [Rotaria sordida]|uniref:Metalloendopeptidase n=2 Tax=Rotaria sordida TaxID=392033 RepID=A0A813VWV7_9BILA|nr:unnamed protein product [Rotaria sordida]